jgi:Ala-tRNA(Pro) deacylase
MADEAHGVGGRGQRCIADPVLLVRTLTHINVQTGQWRSGARTELVRKKPMGIAITLAQYLLDQDVAYELLPHPHRETALASAAASGLPADSVVKAVVLKGADGFLLALLPASRHIEFDELRQVLGAGVDIAGEEQIETLFPDCEPGSVPALGAAYGLDVVVDDSLAQQEDLYFEGGDHAHLVHISGTSFRKLMEGAEHGRFTGRA